MDHCSARRGCPLRSSKHEIFTLEAKFLKVKLFAICAFGACMGLATTGLRAQVTTPAGRDFALPRAEFSLAYSPTEVNAPPGKCGCFFMNGLSAEGNFRAYRGFTAVVDATAAHAGDIQKTGVPSSMIMVTGGTRLNFRVGNDRFYYFKPFAQGLVGVAHGFRGAFPDKQGFIQPTANSLALLVGIGVDYKYRRHLSFRVIQADYGYTRLPNASGNDQNLLRISAGVTYHWGDRNVTLNKK
jgi:outer membrane immunogenic protein